MKRAILVLLLISSILIPGTQMKADDDFQWVNKRYEGERPGPRAFFASAYAYNAFVQEKNRKIEYMYVNGGEGQNGILDPDGIVWKLSLNHAEADWEVIQPTNLWGYSVPPPRKHHCGAMFYRARIDEFNLPVAEGNRAGTNNFVTYGGQTSNGQNIDEMWVFAEFIDQDITQGVWVCAEQSIDPQSGLTELPAARRDAAIVCVSVKPPDEPPPDEAEYYAIVFLYGGRNSSGALEEAFVGMLKRVDIVDDTAPMGYRIRAECVWTQKVDLLPDQGLVGATVLLDPFYGSAGPRILVFGGENESGETVNDLYGYDFSTDDWYLMEATGKPDTRYYQAGYLDIREHRLVIQGGLKPDAGGDILFSDTHAFDLSSEATGWSELPDGQPRYGHGAAYYWGLFFGGYSGDTSSDVMDDVWEYKPEEIGKEWRISKSKPDGCDHPSKVLNTSRIRRGDTVVIEAESENDWFLGKYCFPASVGQFTVEGLPYNGVKPGLYNYYSHVDPDTIDLSKYDLEGENAAYEMDRLLNDERIESVITGRSGTIVRNVRIGFAECPEEADEGECDDIHPGFGIPSDKLTVLNEISQQEKREIMKIILIADKGIAMGGPMIIENCEFIDNVIGIAMTCVSSEPQFSTAHIKGCEFHDNYMGIWCLETSHVLRNNTFSHNHMAGIVFEKGARGRAYDNLMIDNGFEEGIFDGWRAGIISSSVVLYGVPLIQMPLMYNNTFIEECALSMDIAYDAHQYINQAVFMNNIIYYPGETSAWPLWKTPGRDDCQISARNNCIYHWQFEDFCNDPYIMLQSADSICSDPLLDGDDYLLPGSDCINAGVYPLDPGVLSEGGYRDYSEMDIGYHFTDETSSIGSVQHLQAIDDDEIAWEEPLVGEAVWYLIVWMDDTGYLYGSASSASESYEITNPDLIGIGLWFGVSACDEDGRFGTPEFIQM